VREVGSFAARSFLATARSGERNEAIGPKNRRWIFVPMSSSADRAKISSMPEHYDVFLSYARVDTEQVHRLAENLRNAGLEVFLDAWEIAPGDVLVHQLDRGILNSRNGILAVTPAALARSWVQQEYAAMMTRAVAGTQRLIPVLLADAEMPPLLASRVYVDLRRADGPEYEREVRKLISFLKGEKPGPPPRTGKLLPRPDTAVRREEVIARRLQIGR
jgi:hypothetical protein